MAGFAARWLEAAEDPSVRKLKGGSKSFRMYFTFRERKFTMAFNIEGCVRPNGTRPDMHAFVDFLRKDCKLDMASVAGIQFNDIMSGRTALVRFKEEEQVEAFVASLGRGVAWSVCGGKVVTGFRCDSAVIIVKILYVSYEVPLETVVFELSKYGEVKDIHYNTFKVDDTEICDGVIMAKIKLKEEVKELPCWIRREMAGGWPAEVWRLQHRNQKEPGCWNWKEV